MKKGTMYRKRCNLIYFAWVAVVVIALGLGGCEMPEGQSVAQIPESGDSVWIEFPAEGQIVPNQVIPFVVYATSEGSVPAISLEVNGVALSTNQTASLDSDGSGRMARLDQVWQPPAEGEYTLTASASGASTAVTFCVVTCNPEEEVQTGPTPTDTATLPFITLPPEGATDTPTPDTESQVEFWAAPPYINEGECTTLNWNVSGAQTVYYEGGKVASSGSQQECPAESRDYQLQVVGTDSGTTDYWASVDVYEVDEPLPPTNTPTNTSPPPPAEPPTDTPTPTEEPPPADTSGPSINWTTLVWEDCRAFGQAEVTMNPASPRRHSITTKTAKVGTESGCRKSRRICGNPRSESRSMMVWEHR